MADHPAFVRARALPPDLRALFPTSAEEAAAWHPTIRVRALATTSTFRGDATAPEFSGDQDGMTLRQWYAGQALAGLLANPSDVPMAGEANPQRWIAEVVFLYADAMIAHEAAEREKGGA